MNIFFEQDGDSFDLSVRKNVLWALLFGCVRIGSALHFASLSQNGLIFRVPKRSIHKRYVSIAAQKIRTVWPR